METETKLKFVDKQPRSVLSEGRNHGMGLALCKRTGDTIETVGPISPCRDYLNDEVYSNHTHKPYGAWGYHAEDRKLWEAGRAYFAYSICGAGARNPTEYATMKRDLQEIEDNADNILKFINDFENPMGASPTIILKFGPNTYVADTDLLWVKWTYLTSLFSVLITNATTYKQGDVIKHLEAVDRDDRLRIREIMPKIKAIHAGKIPDDDWNKARSWHDAGIQSFAWKG